MNHPIQTPLPAARQTAETNIGRLLLEMDKITPEQAERILRLQKEQGLRFGDAARKLGLVTEGDIRQVLALQFDYPYLQLDQERFSDDLVAAYHPFSQQVEALRALRSQLVLRWFSEGHQTLAVTAANEGDGCSYVAANLAVVFSQLGESTLLIDANLRSPRQKHIFNLGNPHGLSDILVGRAGLEAVSRIDSFVDLSVLGAGTEPPNPQELLNRHAFPELLTQLAQRYDVIILDTAPATASSDMQLIAARARGAIIVARNNATRLADLEDVRQQITETGAQAIGVVLNTF
ncbi:MAG TPA: chain length determinant protein tyrosine kinase EpsG [Methylophilaceae bacterium]|jgi:chain length determinant protein tyrosine kinase EpsG